MPTLAFGASNPNPYEDWGQPPAPAAAWGPPPAPAAPRRRLGRPGPEPAPAPSGLPDYQRSQLEQLYPQYLGRPGSEAEYASWYGNPNYEQGIRESAEAKAFAGRRGAAPMGGGAGALSPDAFRNWLWGATGETFTPQQLVALEPEITSRGWRVHRNAAGQAGKVIAPDQTIYDVIQGAASGLNRRQWLPATGPGGGAMPGQYQFSDPATRQLEDYLNRQMADLEAQRARQEQANVGFRGRQAEAQEATKRLIEYMTERAGTLRGPAYTGTEQEIIRTQALDPLERDRQAAKQRAIQQISARGLEPESGIAQELLNDVDRAFDEQRARFQGDIGYRQVAEQRSREQEAQQLLSLIPQAQRAAASGDLEFLQALDRAVNQPRQDQLPLASLRYQLPNQALNQALAVMGLAPSQSDLFNQAMGLYGIQNQQRQQGLGSYEMLGAALPYLLQGLR